MKIKSLARPSWSAPFIQEPAKERHNAETSIKRLYHQALWLGIFSIIGLIAQLCLLLTTLKTVWIAVCSVVWILTAVQCLVTRPRRFSLVILVLFVVLLVLNCILVATKWNSSFDLKLRLALGAACVALVGLIMVINMPMRDPGRSRFGISKPGSEPNDKLRSPEDNLTFWQWATISWVSPLLGTAKTRQLNEADIWQLPYEFQHTFLHDAFRQLKGSVLRRLLVANWIDLLILTLLELLELATNYADPLLLQQLLKAMNHLDVEKKTPLKYALLILLVRAINAQSEVFSLWYGRRCYERSRGELITMLYEKTLNRKVRAMPKDEKDGGLNDNAQLDRVQTTQSMDESTPLLLKSQAKQRGLISRALTQLSSFWADFQVGLRGVHKKQQEPAGMGKILNLMRNDAYEVAQRFWEYQKVIEKPLGLIVSLGLIIRLLGLPALVGVAVIVVAQILSYFLALVEIKFEKVRRAWTDKRLQQTSQYIESIRHLRWYGWQIHWLKNVLKARQKELNMRIVSIAWLEIIIFNNVFATRMITVAAFWAYTLLAKRELSVDIAFPALQIFGMVQDSMSDIPELIQMFLNAQVALNRIQVFMEEPNKEHLAADSGMSHCHVELRGASFAWPGLDKNVLHDLNLSFEPGITVVYGEVASGKTALLHAILGELDMNTGELRKSLTPIAYCSQTPWLQSMSIRDNILFNSDFDTKRYRKTLQACALVHDLASFESGDLSAIGENGIGLSGGQKMRVALARAVYSSARTVLLDDPLSALDQQTSEHIVNECFKGDLMEGRTVVLVTHRTDLCIPIARQLISIKNGQATASSVDRSVAGIYSHAANGCAKGIVILPEDDTKLLQEAIPEKFEDEEHREHGEIRATVYWQYLKAGGLAWWALTVFMLIFNRLIIVTESWYLKEFSEAYDHTRTRSFIYYTPMYSVSETPIPLIRKLFDQFPNPVINVKPWLIGLLILALVRALSVFGTDSSIQITRYLSGKNLFKAVMEKVTNTTFRYYDVTPVGRLMNRLTSDIGQIDSSIGWDVFHMANNIISWVILLVVIASITPLFLLVSILLTVTFVTVFLHFLPTSQSLRRLETVSLSPLMTNFGALLTGLMTVRAFRAEERFQANLIKVVDTFQGMDHFYWSVQNWLSYRLEMISALSTLVLTIIAIYTDLSAGLTAFALVSAQAFVSTTHQLCRWYGRIQVNFVSVERVVELLDLEQEPTNPVPPPVWWPSPAGNITFDNVTIRYAPCLEPALIDVSFELRGGTNTAIVGRTGSGKSTLAAALLATVSVEKGRILIDGVDLSTVDRQALRTRVTFLAQEPVLFEGTLRHNLDPTRDHGDDECRVVIERVARRFNWTLETPIDTGGKNLSQGQRQLVGLARAILRRSSIVIMDEATASIDFDTAWEIQRVLREELKGSTVITIAHRTAAVRDADNAIVLANGRLESFGPAGEVKADGEDGRK